MSHVTHFKLLKTLVSDDIHLLEKKNSNVSSLFKSQIKNDYQANF